MYCIQVNNEEAPQHWQGSALITREVSGRDLLEKQEVVLGEFGQGEAG